MQQSLILLKRKKKTVLILLIQKSKYLFLSIKNNKEEIQLKLTKRIGDITQIEKNKMENFRVLSTKRQKHTGQK